MSIDLLHAQWLILMLAAPSAVSIAVVTTVAERGQRAVGAVAVAGTLACAIGLSFAAPPDTWAAWLWTIGASATFVGIPTVVSGLLLRRLRTTVGRAGRVALAIALGLALAWFVAPLAFVVGGILVAQMYGFP